MNYNNAKVNLENAQSDLEIIQKGSTAENGSTANTNIRATASGMIVEIPVKKGYQVKALALYNSYNNWLYVEIMLTGNTLLC